MPGPIDITEESLTGLEDKVVIISGGSAGIGLATTNILLSKGAKVVIGDINEPPKEVLNHSNITYLKTDITSWKDLCALFRLAKDKHGRIDHVFCNAGIAGSVDYLDESVDANGDPVEPSRKTFEVDLMGTVNMAKLGVFYMKKQEGGGSIVLNSSAACTQRFPVVDYIAAKNGVHGLLRGLVSILHPRFPIRVNGLAPAWTDTAIVEHDLVKATNGVLQSPEVVARSAVLLMADKSRNGQLLLSSRGRCMEIEEAFLSSNISILKGLFAQ
ncbi:hypothetical protein MGYG_02842 [Nannizzia gypsea CBS 118893]|uniref:Uncharacterized protein n=1 Tax=Arthroderma gypseum (strain ATCC MYA-4604 / CBS 118893) TaxID=535722 RepID=E4UPA4_ARTGP|nr:hypothetical protein MGYG_02842 [Nannizzia gypsea CBS 118893]EFQ99830.1 hypothetical protein MGYG_02842 [Nannizzia gypsea CBS 118893]